MTRGRAVGLLVLANVFWGSSHAVAKTTLETFPPPLLAALRFSIASAVLAAVWAWQSRDGGGDLPSGRDLLRIAGLGVLSIGVAYLLVYWGISLTTATDAALMIIGEVIFTTLLAALIGGEQVGARRWAGVLLGSAGVGVLVLSGAQPDASGGAAARAIGDLLVLAALFLMALYSVWGAGLARRMRPLTLLLVVHGGSLLIWVPLLIWYVASGAFPAASPAAWAGVLYLALIPSVLCNLIWFMVLRSSGASLGAISLFVQPVVGVLLGLLVLRDPLTPWLIAGAALIFLGLGLTALGGPKRAPALRGEEAG